VNASYVLYNLNSGNDVGGYLEFNENPLDIRWSFPDGFAEADNFVEIFNDLGDE
jgi:hypothetical protein